MKEPENAPGDKLASGIKRQLALINYVILGFFLFFSEFLNAIFNNKMDVL